VQSATAATAAAVGQAQKIVQDITATTSATVSRLSIVRSPQSS
jgi:hypothetical protein